jgi:hypothetical protein
VLPVPEITVADVERAWGKPFETTARQCHAVSFAIVQARVIPGARVARGSHPGVGVNHSWVTVGDPYLLGAPIVDATLWSYDHAVTGVWTGRATNRAGHVPLGGFGSIWTYGKPCHTGGDTVDLTPSAPLSRATQRFLDMLGPLDRTGWSRLAHAPVLGWPAAEIIEAMYDTPALRALVEIDRVGMLTDRNPGGLYLPVEHDSDSCPDCTGANPGGDWANLPGED